MAQFQLKLLTSTLQGGANTGTYSSIFLETPITEFYSQEDAYLDKFRIDEVTNPFSTKNTFCYTYNEALSLHQNAQKELTFSMDRKVFVNGAWTTNPFASNIHIGTQLLLIDKYDNEYIFIVKTIAYVNKENNLTYNVTCQDLFTYQMIRQNSGYTIANDDTSSEDYIGALTIDSWVVNYIVPDCFIPYTYLSLNQGLYIDTNGQLRIFSGNQRLIDVKKIIKPAYPERTYPDLYVPIPFSVSGSNADAALIALGAEMGLMLNTFERNSIVDGQRSGYFAKYFWFEPTKKSERVTGLTYSPKQDIQDFSFSHAGDSLTTVLNVESSYAGSADEESVTLLPSIPTFFADYFESQEWLDSKYYTGMFSQICRNKIRVYSTSVRSDLERDLLGAVNIAQGTNTPIYSSANAGWQAQMLGNNQNGFIAKDENGATWVYIPLWEEETPDHHKVLNIPRFYDKIKFTDDTADSNTVSDIVLRGSGENEEVSSLDINFNDHTVALTIFSYHTKVDGETERIIYDEPVDCFMNGGLIPAEFQGSAREVAIKIRINQDSYPSMVGSADISLVFYREPSQEEIEFATVADQCPWLENKLIDFRYFYDHNIISRHEYSTLLDILYNNLRIVNGRLLFYSQAYYEALHKKTGLVAKLTNDLDALGAACQADIIRPFTENGEIADDISAFDKAYELYTNYQTSNQSQNSAVIGWSDTINEYWNKYWGAEQRFLKNIYNFTNYFYAAASSRDSHSVIYDDTINLVNNWQLGFQNDDSQSTEEEEIARTYNYITFSKSTFADIVPDVKDNTDAVIYGFKLYDSNPNSVTYGQPYVPIYNKDNNQLLDIVDATNYANYYVASTPAGSYYTCGNTNSNYKDWKTYYQYGVVFYTAEDTYKENSSFKFTVDKTEYKGFVYKVESLEKNTVSSSTQNGITEEKVTNSSTQYRVTVVLQDKIAANETLMAKAAAKTPIDDIPDAFSATFELIPIDTILMRRYYLRSHDSLYCYTRDDENIYTNQCIPFKDITNEDGEVITPGLAKYLNQTYTFAGLVSTIQSADSYILRNNNTYDQLDDNELDKFNATNFNAYNLDAVPIPPITDYYYYGPVYKLITTTTEKDGKEVITGASRVNAKGQTLADYQAYMEENSGLIKVENPETYQAYQKLNYVTPNNESSYFRNVANAGCAELIPSAAGQTSVAAASIAFVMGGQYLVGLLALGSYLLMTGINALCLSFSGYAPRKSGVCVANFYKQRYDNESKYFTNYSATEDLVYFKNESDLQDRQIFLENKDRGFPNADQDMNYNFFEKVGFTYSSVSKYIKKKGAEAPIWYKTKWYRPIRVSDSINRYDSYKILLIPHAKEGLDESIKINQNNRYLTKDGFKNIMSSDSGRETIKVNDNITLININAFYHFPFNNNLNDITFSGLDWATKTTWSLQDALRALGFTSVTTSSYYSDADTYLNDYILAVTYPNPNNTSETITADLVVFIEETFRMTLWANKTNIYQGETLYQIGTDAPFNFEQQDDFAENLITIRDTASDFVQAHGFDPSAIYYRRYNYSYDRAYTVEQLKGLSNFAKYPNNTSYTTTNLTDSTLTLNVPVILTQTTFIKKGVIFTIEVPNWNGDAEELQSLIGRQWTIQFDNTLFDDFYAANFPLVLQYFSLEGPNEDTLHITFSCSNAEYEVGMNTKWKEHIQSIGCGSVGITFKNDKGEWIASLTILKDDRWVINSTESVASNMNYNFIATSVFDKESLEGSVGTATIVQNGIEYTSQYSWRGVRRQEISGLTNGTFWYLYHNSTQYPTLMEKAAAIETQLQQYWGSAYNASLYCEYFLPEAWQSYYNSYNNHFSAILMKYNPTNNWVALNNKLIPHVQIVVEGGTADLPSYQFKFIQDTNDVLKDVEQRNTTQKQEINRSIEFLNAAQIFRNNPAVKNAMMALGEDLNNWSVQRLNATIKTTYYYADQGGLKWNNLLPTLAKTVNGISNYKELDGLYVMFYKIFRHAYSNRTLPMYESLMNEHNNIWKGIYESYPGVVLENTYTNEDATTSADLLNMARNYFADLSYPERQYNITVIDVAQLKGYEGQELQLGDPIAVNAFEYYDDYDEVYNTLSQYLFVTDISYALRKEGDINLTVNAIKYQDKLIRNLAKLIREPRRA